MVSTANSSLQDVAHSELVLRICGSPRHGQVIRLGTAKCTVGSGPNCTLRLLAKGVQPLHCLIVRGAAATVVRCWGPDTRLNGRQFHDAPLSPGDRLSVGPIDFEVLPALVSDRPHDLAGDGQSAHDPTAQRIYRQAQRLARVVKASRSQNRARVRRLTREIRAQRKRLSEFNHSAFQSEAAADAAIDREEIARNRLELELRREAIEETHRRWLEEQAQAEADLRHQAEELQALRTQLEARSRSRDEQREAADRQAVQCAEQVAAERAELQAERAELQAERKALAEEQSRWETERTEIEQQLHARREELAARQAKLEAAAARLPQDRDDRGTPADREHGDGLSRTQSTSDELEFEKVSADSPVSSQDIFRRLGNMPSFEDDGAPASVSSPTIPIRSIVTDAAPPSEGPEDAEESIDDYMARLLARVRGEAPSTASRHEPAAAESEPPSAARPPASAPISAVTEPNSTAVGTGAPVFPRVAPETLADLRAMRELANLSAQSALNRHTRQTLKRTIRSKLMVALVAVVACGCLGWIWHAYGRHGATLAAATGLSLLVACYWTVQYAVLTGRLSITRTGHLDWNRNEAATVEPVPTHPQPTIAVSPAADREPHAAGEAEAIVARPE